MFERRVILARWRVSTTNFIKVRQRSFSDFLSLLTFLIGGILFQCLFDSKRRDVLAAGGRYDSLVEECQLKVEGKFTGKDVSLGVMYCQKLVVTEID